LVSNVFDIGAVSIEQPLSPIITTPKEALRNQLHDFNPSDSFGDKLGEAPIFSDTMSGSGTQSKTLINSPKTSKANYYGESNINKSRKVITSRFENGKQRAVLNSTHV
jgi:hypothetical protein